MVRQSVKTVLLGGRVLACHQCARSACPRSTKTSVPLVRLGHLWRGVAEHATQRSGRERSGYFLLCAVRNYGRNFLAGLSQVSRSFRFSNLVISIAKAFSAAFKSFQSGKLSNVKESCTICNSISVPFLGSLK
jgi:hypothetical protein